VPLLFVTLFPKFMVLIKLMMFCVGALVPVHRFEKVIIRNSSGECNCCNLSSLPAYSSGFYSYLHNDLRHTGSRS
jgi:hypothetical protein